METKKIIVSVLSLLILDIIWVTTYMGPRYNILVKNIQGSNMKVNKWSALFAYIFMVILLIQFVIKYKFSVLESFLFGMCLYGVYDFTCGAVFTKWDFNLAIIDVIWGGLVYATVTYISKQI